MISDSRVGEILTGATGLSIFFHDGWLCLASIFYGIEAHAKTNFTNHQDNFEAQQFFKSLIGFFCKG
jgi:hypothetical protein